MPVAMRLLFAIPHFFQPSGTGALYGSLRNDPAPRIAALRACILTLHRTFGQQQHGFHFDDRRIFAANTAVPYAIDIAICTTGDRHLLPELDLSEDLYLHVPTEAEPRLLGYECHALMAEFLGAYDYYCYLEDDILIHDPLFFDKLRWFNTEFGDDRLLQPNRYELSSGEPVSRTYIDGEYQPARTARWLGKSDVPELHGTVLGRDFAFQRATNPHAGCFFLTANQMSAWVNQPYFGDRSRDFFNDPMASAATYGIARTFAIYKPAYANAHFLEVQHYGSAYIVSHRRLLAEQLCLEGNFEGALPIGEEALRFDPSHAQTWETLGQALQGCDRLEEAMAAYQRAIELDPTRGFARWKLGGLLVARGDVEAGIQQRSIGLQVTPELVRECLRLGNALLDEYRTAEARSLFEIALSVQPDCAAARVGLGRVFALMGDFDRAVALLEQAIAEAPDLASAYNALGTLWLNQGERDKAMTYLERGLALAPEDAAVQFAYGNGCLQSGDLDGAIAAFQQAIALDPAFAKPYINLGIAWARLGRMAESAQVLQQAVALAPHIPEAHNNLAIALLGLGRYSEAAECCEQALALRPDYDTARQNLAIARAALTS